MGGKGATDETDRSSAAPPLPEPFDARFHNLGMVGKAKIIVRAKTVDRAHAADVDARAHRAFDHLEVLVLTAGFKFVQNRAGSPVKERGACCIGRRHGAAPSGVEAPPYRARTVGTMYSLIACSRFQRGS